MAGSSEFWIKRYLEVHKKDNTELNIIFNEDNYYKWQLSVLSNAVLIDDWTFNAEVVVYPVINSDGNLTKLNWLNKGELICGSFIMDALSKALNLEEGVESNDIDIYFKSKEDALEFININNLTLLDNQKHNSICFYATCNNYTYNLVYGINYLDVNDLIPKFDIRACSVAFCPNKNEFYALNGTADDISSKRIVFNPLPRATSINRLIKYINKGFRISPYQRAFMAQLIKTNIYSTELELNTGGGYR